ncbi:hypothetical protein RYX36_022591 [Vicia faba]
MVLCCLNRFHAGTSAKQATPFSHQTPSPKHLLPLPLITPPSSTSPSFSLTTTLLHCISPPFNLVKLQTPPKMRTVFNGAAIALTFLSLLLLSPVTFYEKCNPQDKKVLLRIKQELNNPYLLASWDPKTD